MTTTRVRALNYPHEQADWCASGYGRRGLECSRTGAGDRREYLSDFFIKPADVARAPGGPATGRADEGASRQPRRWPFGDSHKLPGERVQPVRRCAAEEH